MSNEMKDIVNNIVSSYGVRIESIGEILQGFHDSFFDTRQERELIKAELRESLARNEHLRKKDFDNMMDSILSSQDGKEKEVRLLLKNYLNEQKEMAQVLRENLKKFKDSLVKGEVQRVKEFQEMIKQILAKQDERKNEVTSKLKEFQREQQALASRLKELLAKGRELRIRDFKSMLKEFKTRHKERLARQEERKKEVRHLLGEFKKGRGCGELNPVRKDGAF